MLILPSKRKERSESDFGRVYGWNIIKNNSVIGVLDHIREWGDFWQNYNVLMAVGSYEGLDTIDLINNFWRGLLLSNRKYPKCICDKYIPLPRVGKKVGMRNLYVDDCYYTGHP